MSKRPASTVDLVIKRMELEEQAREASALTERTEVAQAPSARAFWQAHQDLLEMSRARQNHTKTGMLAAYDRRLHAGHAWNPSRQAYRDAARWHRAILQELAQINQDIARQPLSPKSTRQARTSPATSASPLLL